MPTPIGPVLPLFQRLALAQKSASAAQYRQFCRAQAAARLEALRAAARRRALRQKATLAAFILLPATTLVVLRLAGLA